MPATSLPDHASLEQLRNQARDLQRAVRAGAPSAAAEVAERHPAGCADGAAAASFPLSAAQLVVARRYGFASWARLKHHLDVIERYTRFAPAATGDAPRPAGPATSAGVRSSSYPGRSPRPGRARRR